MTLMYGPAVRRKRILSICRLCGLASMYPASDWSVGAPGHHGYQRACVLISGQASSGPFGSPVFACAGKTGPPSRLILSQTSAGNRNWCYVIAVSLSAYRCSSFVRAMRPFLRPGLHILGAPRAGAVKAGRSLRPPAGLGLDGSEHGATLKQVGTKPHASSRIRSCAPC
jgi:hypothetical protein